jgi:hypothetical protein
MFKEIHLCEEKEIIIYPRKSKEVNAGVICRWFQVQSCVDTDTDIAVGYNYK